MTTVTGWRRVASLMDAQAFANLSLVPSEGSREALKEIAAVYWTWCDLRHIEKPGLAETVEQLSKLLKNMQLETETDGKTVYAKNVRVTASTHRKHP